MMVSRYAAIWTVLLLGLIGACDSQQPASSETSGSPASAEEVADRPESPAPVNGRSQAELPDDQTMAATTSGGHFYVVATPQPNPIDFQKLFSLQVDVYRSDRAQEHVDGVHLDQVRATMPAHGHGMKTNPTVSNEGKGQFLVEGMKFHMRGQGKDGHWVIETVLSRQKTIDQAKFDVQCCHE